MDVRQHEERVAIVTGGGHGIGRSIVLGVMRAGVHVIATAGRERSEIEAVGREAEANNARASALPWLPMLPRRVTAKSMWIRWWSALAAWIFW
jgi:NAD(P)-dependent dehydrogenase (short-subunit alcohol dehydrogenase family)